MHLTLPNKGQNHAESGGDFHGLNQGREAKKKSVNLAETGRVPGQYNGEYAMHVLCIRFPDDHSPLFRFSGFPLCLQGTVCVAGLGQNLLYGVDKGVNIRPFMSADDCVGVMAKLKSAADETKLRGLRHFSTE